MRERLALVQFRGTIRDRSVEPYVRLFHALRERRRIRGVLLDISSGGGGDVASTDLYLAVKRLDQVKPVVASIGSVGASGAYMAALGARKLFAYPGSTVGSIGVVFPHVAVRDLLAKLGVQVDLLHEGRHKDAFQGLRPLSDEERAKVQAVASDSYRMFVELVARERHKSVDEILPLATGEFWSGLQAQKLGLVDTLGDREEALEELGRLTGVSPRRLVQVAPPRPFLERVFSGSSSAIGQGLASAVRSEVEDALWESWIRSGR